MAGFRWTLVVTGAAEKYFTMEQALEIGNALGVDWSEFDVEQFRL